MARPVAPASDLARWPPPAMDAALADLGRRDQVLACLIERHGPPRLGLWRGRSHFASLVRSIVYQQLAGSAAAAIHRRLVAAAGGTISPVTLGRLGLEDLRTVGLSQAKARSVADLTSKVLGGELRLSGLGRLDDEEVVRRLVAVRGIGRWTAEMFLLFTLGRPDVWPVDDYGVSVGFAAAWGLPVTPKRKELQALGEPFRPLRSLVAWYCWRAAEERPRASTKERRALSGPGRADAGGPRRARAPATRRRRG